MVTVNINQENLDILNNVRSIHSPHYLNMQNNASWRNIYNGVINDNSNFISNNYNINPNNNNNISYFENFFNENPTLVDYLSSRNNINIVGDRGFIFSTHEGGIFRNEIINQLNVISNRVRNNENNSNYTLSRVVSIVRELIQRQINAVPDLNITNFINIFRNNLNSMIDLNMSDNVRQFSSSQVINIIYNSLNELILNVNLNVVERVEREGIVEANRIVIELSVLRRIKEILNNLLNEIRNESNIFINQINNLVNARINNESEDDSLSSSDSLLETSESGSENIDVTNSEVSQVITNGASTVFDTRESITIPKCSMCMENNSIIVFNCGHLCSCISCSRRVNECPICRVSISRRQRIFLS